MITTQKTQELDQRDIQRIETVNVEDLTRELTPITKLKQFMDNSTIDVKINKKSKVYTVTNEMKKIGICMKDFWEYRCR